MTFQGVNRSCKDKLHSQILFCILVSQVMGFGLMDADALVEKAKTWIKVPEQKLCSTSEFGVYS